MRFSTYILIGTILGLLISAGLEAKEPEISEVNYKLFLQLQRKCNKVCIKENGIWEYRLLATPNKIKCVCTALPGTNIEIEGVQK